MLLLQDQWIPWGVTQWIPGGDPVDVEVNPDFVYLLFAGYDDTLALTERIASIMRT